MSSIKVLSERENEILAAAWQHMDIIPKVNTTTLAPALGYTNVRSCANAWSAIMKKLKANAEATAKPASENTSGAEETVEETTTPTKPTKARATTGNSGRKRKAKEPTPTTSDEADKKGTNTEAEATPEPQKRGRGRPPKRAKTTLPAVKEELEEGEIAGPNDAKDQDEDDAV